MKVLTLILSAFVVTVSSAQIVFEHEYDSASVLHFCPLHASQLMMVNLDVSGQRYLRINRCGKMISLFDLNHNLVKKIDISHLPNSGDPHYQYGMFLYFSEHLFNTDSKMEFMYVNNLGPIPYTTHVFNEDGTEIFKENGSPMVMPTYHMQQYPIYNTAKGTKMILSYHATGKARVFGLPGLLTLNLQKNNQDLVDEFQSSQLSRPSPNPNDGATQINYNLPEGEQNGELIFTDLEGRETRRVLVNKNSNAISISTTELAAGTYLYYLYVNGNRSGTQKMVVIK